MVKTRGRSNKRNNNKQIIKTTLDQKHTEKMKLFNDLNDSLPTKKKKLKEYEIEFNDIQKKSPSQLTNYDISRQSQLIDLINSLKKEISRVENNTELLDYFDQTYDILIDYYDNKDIDENIDNEYIDDSGETGKKTIITYFSIEETSKPVNKSSNKTRISRAALHDKYMEATYVGYSKNKNQNNLCGVDGCDGEKIVSQSDGFLVCNKCGNSESTFAISEKPNYKDPVQDSGTYAYKRINHLTEILSQLQAKESTDIPSKVFEDIVTELRKRKINKNDLEIFKLRKILKKLKYRKYYEHSSHILQRINGKEPPKFTRHHETKIKQMFRDIQEPFSIYCPKDRKNFLNYSYVLHKFCQLLMLDKYLHYFPLLKNNGKLLQHDKIWEKICKHMHWEFYKSI